MTLKAILVIIIVLMTFVSPNAYSFNVDESEQNPTQKRIEFITKRNGGLRRSLNPAPIVNGYINYNKIVLKFENYLKEERVNIKIKSSSGAINFDEYFIINLPGTIEILFDYNPNEQYFIEINGSYCSVIGEF